jgi:DNA-binding ferritin-like protein
MQAAHVAMQHQRHKMHEVVAAVAERLVSVGRVVAAAELQEGINDIQGRQAHTMCTTKSDSVLFSQPLLLNALQATQNSTRSEHCRGDG